MGEWGFVAPAEESEVIAEVESVAVLVPEAEAGDGDIVGTDLEEGAEAFVDVGVVVERFGAGLGEGDGVGGGGGEEGGECGEEEEEVSHMDGFLVLGEWLARLWWIISSQCA